MYNKVVVLVNGRVSRHPPHLFLKMKAKVGIIFVVFLALGFARGEGEQQQQTSSLSQHHNHNEGFEGHTRKVRRLQRLLLHNNRHTMQFRAEAELEDQGNQNFEAL